MTTSPARRWPLWPWLVLTLAGVGITAAAALVGTMTDENPNSTGASSPVTVTVTAVQIQPSTVTRTVPQPLPPGPVDRFDDGLFKVGVDVPPGTFRTNGPDGSNVTGCYWSRIAPSGDVIANGVLRAPGTVTMSNGDRFDTTGCQPWQRAV
jgi:hypothetical protein